MANATPSGSSAASRFLKLTDLAETLNISLAQAYALVRSGDLAAIKVGGRGQWRVERTELERYVTQSYADTRAFISEHPFGSGKDESLLDDDGQVDDRR